MPVDELVARAAPSLQIAMTGGRRRPVRAPQHSRRLSDRY
jgi:hypothetical protein